MHARAHTHTTIKCTLHLSARKSKDVVNIKRKENKKIKIQRICYTTFITYILQSTKRSHQLFFDLGYIFRQEY